MLATEGLEIFSERRAHPVEDLDITGYFFVKDLAGQGHTSQVLTQSYRMSVSYDTGARSEGTHSVTAHRRQSIDLEHRVVCRHPFERYVGVPSNRRPSGNILISAS